jgi:RNA polymerase sigma factor (sigma-70 family)
MTTVPPTHDGTTGTAGPADVEGPSDAELITAVRSGQTDAFGVLYRRHVPAALRLARQLARSPAEADDLVSEAFAKVLDTLRGGGGPDAAFRAYLLTTLRNTLYDKTRKDKRLEFSGEMADYDPGVPFRDTALEGLEASMVARAYASLPERWQTVLWHTEIEGEAPAQVAPLLGLTPNGVSALAYRAREGLRQAYLQVHLADTAAESCRYTVERLGAWARNGLSKREGAHVRTHLDTCERCTALAAELTDVNRGLLGVIAPLVIGAPWVAGYLAAGAAKGALVGTAAAGAAAGGAVAGGAAGGAAVGGAAAGGATAGGAAGGAAKAGLVAKVFKTPGGQATVAGVAAVAVAAGLIIGLSGGKTPAPRPTAQATAPAPTTNPPAPPPQVDLGTAEAFGELGSGRDGVIALPVTNGGTAAVRDVVADLLLSNGAKVRSTGAGGQNFTQTFAAAGPTASVAAAGDDTWNCQPTATGGRCTLGLLAAGGRAPLYLQVTVPAGVTTVTVSGTLSVPGATPQRIPPRVIAVDGDAGAALPAFATTAHASVLTAGNTVLSCPTDAGPLPAARCVEARHNITGLPIPFAPDTCSGLCNDDWRMTPYAPSRATLALPAGTQVLWAGLFWSGTDPGRSAARGTVLLTPPGGKPVRVRASAVHALDEEYQGYADVTRTVRAGGVWQVAGVVAQAGRGNYGGWSLVVVVSDPKAPRRQITVLDGLHRATAAAVSVPVPWLAAPTGTARVDLVGWEGDRGLGGERITLDGQVVDDGDRLVGHANGAFYTLPGESAQTFGVDTLSATVRLGGAARSTLTATAGRDHYLLGPVAVTAPAP